MNTKRPYSAYELVYYNRKDGKLDYSKAFAITIYSRSESGAEKQFKRTHPNTYVDIIESKVEPTYQDLYEILSRMTKKEREQSVSLTDMDNKNDVYLCSPYYEGKNILFEVYIADKDQFVIKV